MNLQTFAEILTVILVLGTTLLFWVLILPYLKQIINWYKKVNKEYYKWSKDKNK